MSDLGYIHTPKRFLEWVPRVNWNDVFDRLDYDLTHLDTIKEKPRIDELYIGLYKANTTRGNVKRAVEEVRSDANVNGDIDIYAAFTSTAECIGRHQDDHDVLIVQASGVAEVSFDDGNVVRMLPGDSLYIPAGVYHDPVALSPRITLSFSYD